MGGLILSLAIGAVLGGVLGSFGRGRSGLWFPFANWMRGAYFGAVTAALINFCLAVPGNSYPHAKNVKLIAEADFDTEVTRAGQPVVVDFFATWCGPCRMLAPVLDTMAGEYHGRVKFVSLDLDHSRTLAEKFSVHAIPTLLFIGKDGKIVDTTLGVLSEDELREKLQSLLASPPKPASGT
jgi:thioredoxin 1